MIQVHPSSVVSESVQLEEGVTIGPNCFVDSGVILGAGTKLEANVVIGENVRVGRDNHFFPSCVIGMRPQVLAGNSEARTGGLEIGDGNTIREQVTIHPSMYPDESTKIGSNNLLMIGVHIGHDCVLGDQIVMSNYVQISGHCRIGTGVWLSGMVLFHQFVTIGKWCYASGLAGLNHDIPPFLIVSGHYPSKVRGVNKRGLVRAGLDERQRDNIIGAYRKLYRNRNGKTLLENARELAGQDGIDENVRAMVDTIIKSGEHRYGRHLETFRH